MSVSAFVSITSWISFIALTWLMIFNYWEGGQGVSPKVGICIFLIMAVLSTIANSANSAMKGGDIDEP